ncbi:dUTP diphosphatase [Aerococcaceae bacterium WGS1372]
MTNNKLRGFEVIEEYKELNINLPQRSTRTAAGYDIEAAETIVIPSMVKQLLGYFVLRFRQIFNISIANSPEVTEEVSIFKSTLVPTGIKAYMQEDEYLQVINRSSNPLKRFLSLPNSIGIIDQDYYNNSDNEGHIYVQLINYGLSDFTIEKGDRIAQGIFAKFLTVDGDTGGLSERTGGFGSSDVD